MAVEFRVLGDIEARVDGQRLETGHARQRCVLVALLIDVNRAVQVDALINRVWADDPPHRARNTLAGYLSRLRTLFAGVDGVEVSRRPGGYMLTTDPSSVDLHRFRRLVAQARTTPESAEAAVLFGQALDLWRGEPFASLDTPWINDVRTALEAERLSVAMDRNDVALRAGRHSELLGDLTTSHQLHPLDERLAGQLMLALYRSGRQAEALDTYRQMRERLVEELGVDPSPPLRAVHRQILDGEEVDPVPVQTAASTRPAYVTELPRRTTSFIGREQQVLDIGAALRGTPLVSLTGVGGVGKTRLALEVAEWSKEAFADGVWFCELAPLNDGAAVSHAVAAALRLQEGQGLGIEATVIEFLRTRELLLVVDNCEHVLDAAAQLVDRIVRDCPRVSVLATSREPLATSGERVMPVPPLPDRDAAELFTARAKASRPDFDPDREPVGAVAEICRQLDGVPLAIELAAARMRMMSSLDVARRLDRLRLLSGGARGAHPRQHSVAATIDWSYRLLAAPEQVLFERLSVFAGGFDLEAAHGVCAEPGAGEDDTLDLLAGLVDKSMVTVRSDTATTRYGVLETLRAYGRDRLQDNDIYDQYAMRHASYFIELVERAAAGIRGPGEQAWVERLAPNARTTFTVPDYDNLRVAFEHAIGAHDVDLALRLVTSLPELVHLRTGYHSAEWTYRAIELADPDHPLFAAAVGVAARSAWVLGEFARARSLSALAEGRFPGPGAAYGAYPADVLADVVLYEGDAAAALAHYEGELERARHLAGRDGDPFRLLFIMYNLTICHEALGTPEAGLPAAQEAMGVAEITSNPTARSMARCALGRALANIEPDRALASFDQAAELAASVQNNWLTGIALMEAAAIRAEHGDPAITAPMFLEVFDHWERGGPGTGSQAWLTLRYVTRLLFRLGADADVVALHRALVDTRQNSPLSEDEVARLGEAEGVTLTGAEAVALARSSLQRYC